MGYGKNVVWQILDIMEEGPLPLRDGKPVEVKRFTYLMSWGIWLLKVKTGVELFQDSNQGYKVSDSKVDLVERVNEHNSTYPKMKDELDKRHSLSKATALERITSTYKHYHKLNSKSKKPLKGKLERPRRYTRKSKGKRGVDKSIRKTGRKVGYKKTYPLCTCNRLNFGCQCSTLKEARNRMSGTDDILTFDLSIPKSTNFAPMDVFLKSQSAIQPDSSEHGGSIQSLYRKKVDDDDASNNSKFGIASVQDPDTSDPSISSYNSFASTGNEPMV